MKNAEKLLRIQKSLPMSGEQWGSGHNLPAAFRDGFVAVDAHQDKSWEVVEVLTSRAQYTGGKSEEFYLSTFINSDSKFPVEYHLGSGRFVRTNQPGSLIFADQTRVEMVQGTGLFHAVGLYARKSELLARMSEIAGREIQSLEPLYEKEFFDEGIPILLAQLISEYRKPPHSGRSITTADLVDRIVARLLLASKVNVISLTPDDRLTPISIRRVIEYIHAHLGEDLSRQRLASVAGVEENHFTRLFRQSIGTTPKRFLLNLRVEAAKNLLSQKNSQQSLTEVAQACGFFDHSHLGREFRLAYGVTPDAFRRSHR